MTVRRSDEISHRYLLAFTEKIKLILLIKFWSKLRWVYFKHNRFEIPNDREEEVCLMAI
jgi:hypothetical protein